MLQERLRRSVGLEGVGELRGAVERLRAVRVLRVELPVYLVQQRLPANTAPRVKAATLSRRRGRLSLSVARCTTPTRDSIVLGGKAEA